MKFRRAFHKILFASYGFRFFHFVEKWLFSGWIYPRYEKISLFPPFSLKLKAAFLAAAQHNSSNFAFLFSTFKSQLPKFEIDKLVFHCQSIPVWFPPNLVYHIHSLLAKHFPLLKLNCKVKRIFFSAYFFIRTSRDLLSINCIQSNWQTFLESLFHWKKYNF